MTSREDDHTRREPYKKTGRRPYRNKTSQEFNLTGREHHKKTTLQKYRKKACWKMIASCVDSQLVLSLAQLSPSFSFFISHTKNVQGGFFIDFLRAMGHFF